MSEPCPHSDATRRAAIDLWCPFCMEAEIERLTSALKQIADGPRASEEGMKQPLTEKDVVEIVRREVAELAFEQVKECTSHWKAEWPLALILREAFRVLGVRATTRWGRSAGLRKWTAAD